LCRSALEGLCRIGCLLFADRDGIETRCWVAGIQMQWDSQPVHVFFHLSEGLGETDLADCLDLFRVISARGLSGLQSQSRCTTADWVIRAFGDSSVVVTVLRRNYCQSDVNFPLAYK